MVDFKDKNVLVLGLGRFGGGVGVSQFLCQKGARVRVSDTASREDLSLSIDQLRGLDIDYRLGDQDQGVLDGIDLIVVNPAIPPHHPLFNEISIRQIPITTEANLFLENCQGKVIGIVGTNGKETVLKMVEAMLEKSGLKYFVGGNVGTSLLDKLDQIDENSWVLFEFSSFQLNRLRLIKKRPEIAALINIQEDHLDWHGSFENYLNDKLVVLEGQGHEGVAVINSDNKFFADNLDRVEGRLIKVGLGPDNDIHIDADEIVSQENGGEVLSTTQLKVPGGHNLLNALVATGIGVALGFGREIIEPALTQFNGIEHALEFVSEQNGIKYYDDSAATNPEATIAALNSFKQPIWLIIGGYDKQIDYQPVITAIAKKAKGVAVIGQLSENFYQEIKSNNPSLTIDKSINLDRALAWIKNQVKPGDVVVLSPATSSYDQFKNLEERGDIFKKLILGQTNES